MGRFIATIRAEVEKETGLNGIAVTKHLSARWNALAEEEKAVFNTKASKDMEKWKKKMAAYKKTRKYAEFQAAKKAKKVAKKPKDKNQPKRPMSAFMFFSNDMRPKVQAELGTSDFGPVAKKVSELWQNIDASTKAKYEAQNEKAKAKYAKALETYKKSKKYAEYQEAVAEWKLAVKEAKKAMKEQGQAAPAPLKKIQRRRR